jgi:hypothetical protein
MKAKNKLMAEMITAPYAWPGGYPKYAITDDGGCLCRKCVKDMRKEISRAFPRSGWFIIALDINWESLIHCDHCGNAIESAYEVGIEDV